MATGSVRRGQLTNKVEGAEKRFHRRQNSRHQRKITGCRVLLDFSPLELRGRKQQKDSFKTVSSRRRSTGRAVLPPSADRDAGALR